MSTIHKFKAYFGMVPPGDYEDDYLDDPAPARSRRYERDYRDEPDFREGDYAPSTATTWTTATTAKPTSVTASTSAFPSTPTPAPGVHSSNRSTVTLLPPRRHG